jgi:hypothetical protein
VQGGAKRAGDSEGFGFDRAEMMFWGWSGCGVVASMGLLQVVLMGDTREEIRLTTSGSGQPLDSQVEDRERSPHLVPVSGASWSSERGCL